MLTVKIIPNDNGNPPGKLADAELHFTQRVHEQAALQHEKADHADYVDANEVLDGLKLVGFAIWERRSGGGRNVTFPARQYAVNGERRSFALLRSISDNTAQDRIRDLILAAYAEFEQQAAVAG